MGLNLNLRQIIRNQKTKNFDLISLISEAPENGTKNYEDFLDDVPSITRKGDAKGSGTRQVTVRTALGYKSNGFKNNAGQKSRAQEEAYAEALGHLTNGIETDAISRSDIPASIRDDVETKTRQRKEPTSTDGDGEEDPTVTTVNQRDDDFDAAREFMKGDDDEKKAAAKKAAAKKAAAKKKKKDTEDGKGKETKKDREAIEKINEFLPESIRRADPSIARALHYGYKKIPDAPPARAGEIWTPAPGNASSLFNETVSMIGAEILKANPEMTRKELSEALEESLSGTAAWEGVKDEHINTTIDAAITKHNMTREAMEAADIKPKDAKTKSYYGTAVSLQNQYDDIMNHKGPFYGGNGQKIKSIPTDTETKMFLEDFKDPATGEKLSEQDIDDMLANPTNSEVIKRFLALSAYNGGGGGNPSDTATIITDPKDNKMQFIAFSDKTSLGDQQANSTPNQLINNFYGTMRILEGDGYDFDTEEKKLVPPDEEERNIKEVIEEQGQRFKDAERDLGKAQSAPFNVLAKLLSDPDNKEAKEIFDKAYDPPDSERYKPIKELYETLKDDPDSLTDPKKIGSGVGKKLEAMETADPKIEPLPTWGYYLQQVNPKWKEGQEITPQMVEAAYIARAGDSREFKLLNPKTDILEPTSVGDALTPSKQQRYISDAIGKLRKAAEEDEDFLEGDDKEAVVNQQREIARYREKSVNALNEMHDQLNEFAVKNENGEESRMGDTLMAMDMARALHLGMIDKNAPGLFSSGSVHIVAGEHRTSPELMRHCLDGIDNTDDLVRNTRTRPVEKSGPQLGGRGSMSGLYESELSRSTDEEVTNDEGEKLYIVDGEYSWSAKPPEKPGDVSKKDWKNKVQGPLGPITGRKVFAYILDAEGKEKPIGQMSMRTKGGTTLQTTYTFAKDLKECLEKESGSTNESFNVLLGNILAEEKQNTLGHHWKKAEDNYPVHYFIRELNEESLN